MPVLEVALECAELIFEDALDVALSVFASPPEQPDARSTALRAATDKATREFVFMVSTLDVLAGTQWAGAQLFRFTSFQGGFA